ncbi:hypothetical protein ACOME3_002143 [Neoechinorhynchus agilis]
MSSRSSSFTNDRSLDEYVDRFKVIFRSLKKFVNLPERVNQVVPAHLTYPELSKLGEIEPVDVLRLHSLEKIHQLLKYCKLNTRGEEAIIRKRLKQFLTKIHNRQRLPNPAYQFSQNEYPNVANKIDFYVFVNVQCNIPERGNIGKYFASPAFKSLDDMIDMEPRRKIWSITSILNLSDYIVEGSIEKQEIIRFDALMLRSSNFEYVSSFGSYACPSIERKISNLTKAITKISQTQVETAPKFSIVFDAFWTWLRNKGGLKTMTNVIVFTKNSNDLADYLRNELSRLKRPFPYWARFYVNVLKAFQTYYKIRTKGVIRLDTYKALYLLGMPHLRCECCPTGSTEVVNLARVAKALFDDDCCLAKREYISDDPVDKVHYRLRDSEVDKIRQSLDSILLNEYIDRDENHDFDCDRPCTEQSIELPDVIYLA